MVLNSCFSAIMDIKFYQLWTYLFIICVIGGSGINGQASSPPSEPQIEANTTSIREFSTVTITCRTVGGEPSPEVFWLKEKDVGKDPVLVDSDYRQFVANDGKKITENSYTFEALRQEHYTLFRCQVKNSATPTPLIADWRLYVAVVPTNAQLEGPSDVVAGKEYEWNCFSASSLPAGNLNWRLGVKGILQDSKKFEDINPNNDNTFSLHARLKYAPKMEDNNKFLSCELEHDTLESKNIAKIRLRVAYTMKPRITVDSHSYNVFETDKATLTCSIDAKPELSRHQWYYNDELIIPDTRRTVTLINSASVLTITSTRLNDTGNYRCSATNDLGTTLSDNITLQVAAKELPTLIVSNKPLTFQEGSEAQIPCSIISTPPATDMTWTLNNNLVSKSDPRMSNYTVISPTLVIRNIQRADAGTYVCSATNIHGTTNSAGIKVEVQYKHKPVITFNKPLITKIEDDNVTLECTVSADPSLTEFYWTYNGKAIVTSDPRFTTSVGATHKLTITSLKLGDSGKYGFVARNELGNSTADTTLNVQSKSGPVINVNGKNDYEVNEFSSVELFCSITSAAGLTSVVWMKDGKPVNVNNLAVYRGGTLTTHSLTIRSAKKSDIGNYTCTATDPKGTASSPQISVQVIYRPKISLQQVYNGITSSSITLTCTVDANPSPTHISWFKSNVNLNGDTRISFNTSVPYTSSMTITDLKSTDAGQYYCRSNNSLGETSVSTFLTVSAAPRPVVSVPQTYYSVTEGQKVVLACTVSSQYGIPNTVWYHDGKFVDVNIPGSRVGETRYSIGPEDTPSLTIFGAKNIDEGFYECVSTNSGGTTRSQRIQLYVKLRPQLEIIRSITGKYQKSVTLKCEVTSREPLTKIEWFKDSRPFDSTTSRYTGGTLTTTSLTINKLDFPDIGAYSCRATNDAGSTISDSINLQLTVFEIPIISIDKTEYVVKEGIPSVTLKCNIASDPAPKSVFWQKNGKTITASSKYSFSLSSPSLVIQNPEIGDSDNYVCLAENDDGQAKSPDIQLTVQALQPPVVRVSKFSYNAVEGSSSVTLICNVDDQPKATSLIWTKNGQFLNVFASLKYKGGTLSVPSLTILNPVVSDEAKYICSASNSDGKSESSQISLKIVKPNIPTIDTDVLSYDVYAGSEDLVLVCNVSKQPAATEVNWYKDGLKINLPSSKYSGGTTLQPSLTIKNPAISDTGYYICSAGNSEGFSNSSIIQATVRILNPPDVIVNVVDYKKFVADSMVLQCSVTGTPPPTSITWYKNGIKVDTTLARYSGGTTSVPSLTITGVTTTDTGKYVCSAFNGKRKDSPDISLSVSVLNPPDVIVNVVDYKKFVGDTVVLQCSVTGTPPPTSITWYKNGIKVDTTLARYSGGTTSVASLTITGVTTTDTGKYVCSAFNGKKKKVPTATLR